MSGEKPSTDDDVEVNTDFAAEEQPEANSSEDALAIERDRVLRLTAELQNLRNRQTRELADLRKYAPIELMRDILPVLDNMDRALDAASKTDEGESLLEGIRLVRGQLASALAQHGCVEITAEGEAFDPDRHQAILQQPSLEVPAGEVMMVTQAGYQLHDRVVRAAHVIVSAGPAGADGSA